MPSATTTQLPQVTKDIQKMDRPDQALYTPPGRRSDSDESISLAADTEYDTKYDNAEPVIYDIIILPSLISLQADYAETFADDSLTTAEAFTKRKALKQEMTFEYGEMVTTAIDTFHGRTRCPTCKQTPITVNYLEMNHSLPKGAWIQWRDLCKKMMEHRPEILDGKDWIEFLGEMKTIEMWYWEDNTASVECGRVSWNGNIAPHPISMPEENEDSVAVAVPYSGNSRQLVCKEVFRYGKVKCCPGGLELLKRY
ncbi:hypothetical protein BKA61DRAFT_683848 [Leptodontidium sp. MPI-SDFR-AT-0119]|nr:hypothetical protein BKA61DRAFT_683848 [Leptodontidium sp. MPI-SDFR-AT-0119]